MQKAIKAKANASFLFPSIFRKRNQCIAYRKQLTKNTKATIQKVLMRDLRTKELKLCNQKAKLALAQLLLVETFNKACKEKKKNYQGHNQDH